MACTNYFSGNWVNTPNNLRVHSYPDVAYWYPSYSQGLWSWNYISRDVMIVSHHSGSHACSPDVCHIRLRSRNIGNTNYYAVTELFYKGWFGIYYPDTNYNKTWHYSVVTINLDNNLEYIHSWEVASPFQKQKLIVHELGHSIGLAHPTYNCKTSIMHGDHETFWKLDFNTPQRHDRDTVRAKYGSPYYLEE